MSKLTCVFADRNVELNCTLFRIGIPAKHLKMAGVEVENVHYLDIDYRTLGDTVLLERILFPDLIAKLRYAGVKRIVGTFDDAYHLMPDILPAKEYWTKERINDFRLGIGKCDQVIVPSRALVDDYAKYGNVTLVPNYHDDELWESRERQSNKSVVIAWGGSLGHIETWKRTKLLEAMEALYQKYKSAIQFVICSGIIPDVIIEHEFHCNFISRWMSLPEWANYLRGVDIGIAPVACAYDRRRSSLRLVELGLARTPFVASNTGEYQHSGATGGYLVTDMAEEWFNRLSELIEDASLRDELGQKGREWAEGYLMSGHVEEYKNVLQL